MVSVSATDADAERADLSKHAVGIATAPGFLLQSFRSKPFLRLAALQIPRYLVVQAIQINRDAIASKRNSPCTSSRS